MTHWHQERQQRQYPQLGCGRKHLRGQPVLDGLTFLLYYYSYYSRLHPMQPDSCRTEPLAHARFIVQSVGCSTSKVQRRSSIHPPNDDVSIISDCIRSTHPRNRSMDHDSGRTRRVIGWTVGGGARPILPIEKKIVFYVLNCAVMLVHHLKLIGNFLEMFIKSHHLRMCSQFVIMLFE